MIVPKSVLTARETAAAAGQAIILVTGVFDVLHQEHRVFLEKAKALGWLVVGLESDVRVRAMKGEDRPINSQLDRLQALQRWAIADQVFILPDNFESPQQHEQLIAQLRPAVLAVSSHTAHLDKKQAIVAQFGGKVVVVHEHNPAISTTQLLQTLTTPD